MKIAKKFLGVALAIIMTFNVFAMGTVAAGTESAVDLYIATDKTTYAPGEEVVLTVSVQAIDAVGPMLIGGGYAIGYDSSVIVPYSTSTDNLTDHGFVNLVEGYDASSSSLMDASMTSVDADGAANYNWDTVIIYAVADDWATSYDATSKTDVFTVKMKIADAAADGTYTIGFNKASYEDENAYINDAANLGIYGYYDTYGTYNYGTDVNFGLGTCTFTVATAAAEPEVVALDDTMARMDDWTKAESTNTFDGGLIGQINNLNLTFTQEGDRLQCDQIDTIEVYANGKKMGNAYQVYKVNDTTYQFRAVITNMDKTAETYADDVEYEFRVTLKGDYADTTLTATKTVSAKAIYEEAYAAYQLANP